jgi:short-subunit dehydrogenase
MPTDAPAGAGSIVITGASGGLGAALAIEYARPGCVLALSGRRSEALQSVVGACMVKGAAVEPIIIDVNDAQGVSAWLTSFDARHPIELMIVNAGIFTGIGRDGLLESAEQVRALLRTNLESAILNANVAAELMRRHRRGRIALITSLAARQPLADAPAYSASKAGLVAYGEALRERLVGDGVSVSIVLPGHIATAQVANHRGALPLLMSASEAAQVIRRRLDRGASTIAFPLPLVWLIALGRCLPWRLRALAGRSFRFSVDEPD